MIAQTTYETGLAYTLSVIPLFILMGNFVVRARMSEELYHAAYTFLGHRRGGLAMSTIVACAVSARSAARRSPPPRPSPRWPIRRCASSATRTRSPRVPLPRAARSAS